MTIPQREHARETEPAPNEPTVALEPRRLPLDSELSAAPHAPARGDLSARLLGLLLCLFGVAIVGAVIWQAYLMYQDPQLARITSSTPTGPTAVDVGQSFVRLIVRIGLLGLMSICGSVIANKGIHMFLASFPGKTT